LNKKTIISISIVAAIALIAVGVLIFTIFFQDSENGDEGDFVNMTEVGFFQHFTHLNPSNILITMDGEFIGVPTPPALINGNIYLPADFLRTHVDRYIFWEADTNRLTITSPTEIHRFTPNAATFTTNWVQHQIVSPIQRVGDMAFVPADMVAANYPLILNFQPEYNILIIESLEKVRHTYSANFATDADDDANDENPLEWTPIRTASGLQHPIIARLVQDERVTLIRHAGAFAFVQNQNGLTGYVLSEHLMHHSTTAPITAPPRPRRQITRPGFEGNINMVWHLVTSPASAANRDNWYTMQGVNVLSPTWLYFCRPSMDGTIINFGNREYVTWAHANGMEVWPMISDAFFSPETGPEVFTNEAARLALMNAETRDFIINQIMEMIHRYNWDGVNVDYEAWTVAEVDHFIQFLRELSVPMSQAGAVLSVAVFNPLHFNQWRNYPDTAAAVDFLTIMAYDEHYGSSATPGSVSSFPFVETGLLNLLDWGVAPHQIVIGLPTYMRVWTEQFNTTTGNWELLPPGPGGNPLPEFYPYRRTRSVGMQFGYNIIRGMGGQFEWDYILRQYVAHVYHTHNGVELRTSAWLNDLNSTEEKLSLIGRHNLAGVVWWRKGLALPAMWPFAHEILSK